MTTPALTQQTLVERTAPQREALRFGDATVTLENVSPSRARELLQLNTANRPLTKSVVERYVKFMEASDWPFTADPIKFSSENVLLDGQHRLHAIVSSGKTLPMLIARGLQPAVFTNLDQGKRRSLSDFLALLGIPNYTIAATCLTNYARYLNMQADHGRLSNKQAISLYESKKDLFDEAAHFAAGNGKYATFMGQAAISTLFALVMEYYLKTEEYDDAVDLTKNYMLPLVHGNDLSQTDARFAVRRKLINWSEQGTRPNVHHLVVMLVKATNLWLKGTEVKSFRMPVVDSNGVFYKPAVGE